MPEVESKSPLNATVSCTVAAMLDHPMGADSEGGFRLDFDPRVRLEFHGSKISSDGGLLLFRELDETLGLQDVAGLSLLDR